ncbi:uncharacterized protein N7459_008910 [Penicillium hispanicum]|uniref:uncharacterized protein n=1 Tax=Penicillium hispanicum TaxID=1080232 RepID=UPI00254255AA|nr:uncharacterized protein N7459_008910 [Penicillium hispanicum]KAJ5569480.1 hypothetical protein N7459_008910 [Penicillium hispanicum]
MAQFRPPGPGRSASAHPFESKLSQQLQPEAQFPQIEPTTSHSPKSRSLSDASKPTATTQPSTGDLSRPPSKDDSALPSLPATPSRSNLQPRLSLNLPSKTSGSPISRAPLSPKLDSSAIYGSPGSVLPRRSRGLDFSRACTHLHHSTLAESSPDSSPTIGGRGMTIPQRRGSLGSTSVPPFSTSGPADRTTISSSVSSVNMMESDTSSSDDDDDEAMVGDRDDIMLSTPQATRAGSGPSPFTTGNIQSPGNEWMGGYSQAAASLMSFQRARFRKGGRSRHSSSSASGNSSKPSPGPHSPPVMKSVENSSAGYFAPRQTAHPRRESLSLGTRDLRLSDLSDDGETRARAGSPTAGSHSEGGPLGVIRRAVTRRGSLLPKTKTFARIRAALMEEGAPVDSDMKREAEVVRQVRDTEPATSPTVSTFPSLQPPQSVDTMQDEDYVAKSRPSTSSFSKQASRNSGGVEFWNSFDERYRTPPPVRQGGASSVPDDDILMDMTPSTTAATDSKPRSRSSTPHAPGAAAIGELRRKRRREDDFDPNLIKRRAVSPSVSAQSSPVLTNSSTVIDNGPNIWGPPSKLGPPFSERPSAENGNRNMAHPGTAKRVGLQGMTEASDGFMNMSIE